MTDDIAAWLTAIWDEDEKSVERAVGDSPSAPPITVDNYGYLTVSRSVMLARISAERALLARYVELVEWRDWLEPDASGGAHIAVEYMWEAVKIIASGYAARPEYDEAWRP